MIYNLGMYSAFTGKLLDVEYGFDGRPLRYTVKAFAEREAHERNISMVNETGQDPPLYWKVIEENND